MLSESSFLYLTQHLKLLSISTRFHKDTTFCYEYIFRTRFWAQGQVTLSRRKSELHFLFATHWHLIHITFSKFHPNISIHLRDMAQTHNLTHIYAYIHTLINQGQVTKKGMMSESWFLFMTHRLRLLNISTRFHKDVTFRYGDIFRTQILAHGQ